MPKIGRRTAPALIAMVFAALTYRLFRVTSHYAVNVFFWDQWDFNEATLFEKHSLWEIFRWQHGPHRQGVGGLFAALVDPWSRWNGRTEAFVAASLVVAAAAAMLLLKYRLFGPLVWTDILIPIVALAPSPWETLWLSTNFAHGTMPVLLLAVYCLAWTWRNPLARYGAVLLLNFAILYTGFGLFIGLVTPVLLFAAFRAVESPKARAYLGGAMAVAALSFASFFVHYQHNDASGCDSLFSEAPIDYLHFFDLLYSSPFGFRDVNLAATLAGGAALLAIAAVGAAAWKHVFRDAGKTHPAWQAIAALATFCLLFGAAATVGRTCIGLDDAQSSRYRQYLELGVLALYFAALAWGPSGRRRILPVAFLVLLLPSVIVPAGDVTDEDSYSLRKSAWRDCYKDKGSIAACNDQAGPIYPEPEKTHLQQKLDFLRAHRLNLFADAPTK